MHRGEKSVPRPSCRPRNTNGSASTRRNTASCCVTRRTSKGHRRGVQALALALCWQRAGVLFKRAESHAGRIPRAISELKNTICKLSLNRKNTKNRVLPVFFAGSKQKSLHFEVRRAILFWQSFRRPLHTHRMVYAGGLLLKVVMGACIKHVPLSH